MGALERAPLHDLTMLARLAQRLSRARVVAVVGVSVKSFSSAKRSASVRSSLRPHPAIKWTMMLTARARTFRSFDSCSCGPLRRRRRRPSGPRAMLAPDSASHETKLRNHRSFRIASAECSGSTPISLSSNTVMSARRRSTCRYRSPSSIGGYRLSGTS